MQTFSIKNCSAICQHALAQLCVWVGGAVDVGVCVSGTAYFVPFVLYLCLILPIAYPSQSQSSIRHQTTSSLLVECIHIYLLAAQCLPNGVRLQNCAWMWACQSFCVDFKLFCLLVPAILTYITQLNCLLTTPTAKINLCYSLQSLSNCARPYNMCLGTSPGQCDVQNAELRSKFNCC